MLSDINAVYLVNKLVNRHWVDKDITDLLDKLSEYLDENYKVFSSIDKWKKEVTKRQVIHFTDLEKPISFSSVQDVEDYLLRYGFNF